MSEIDYPAAHSMDTLWFAVDRDGRVAAFSSGEAGAVPLAACVSDEDLDVEEQLRATAPAGEPIFDLRGRVMPGQSGGSADRAWTEAFPVVLFLTSLDPVRDLL